MDELKARIRDLFEEIEFVHLKGDWAKRIVAGGVSKEDSLKWVTELGNIVDEYRLSIELAIDLTYIGDLSEATQALDKWLAYTRDVSMPRISDALDTLEGSLEKYLPPPNPEDEDE